MVRQWIRLLVSEPLACRDGLEAAVRRQLPQVILQTYYSPLVSLWHDVRQVRMCHPK
jgi:hypothetical protein